MFPDPEQTDPVAGNDESGFSSNERVLGNDGDPRNDRDPEFNEGLSESVAQVRDSADHISSTTDNLAVDVTDAPDQPTWLHPSSLVFDMISHFRQLLIPAVIALFSAAQGSWEGMVFAVVLFVPAIMFSVFRFFTLRYMVANGEMIIKQGLIFRRLRTVPVNRIQNIDLIQNPLHRLLGVAEVRVETASGKDAEATLRVLSMRQLTALRKELFQAQESNPVSPELVGTPGSAPTPADISGESVLNVTKTAEVLLQIPSGLLVRAGLASNRGMLLIGIVAGLFYQYDLESKLEWRRLLKFLPAMDGSLINILMLSGAVLVVLALLRLVGVVWYFLRFHGYRLERHGEDLRISCGLFTRVSATIPRRRIQFISIHRTLVMRWMNLAAIRIETAGGGGGQSDNASTMVSRRWFVPVIPEDRIAELLMDLRPGLKWDESALDWKPLASNARARLIRLAIVQSVIVAIIGLGITRPWGWLAGVLLAPAMIAWSIKKSRAMRYCRSDQELVYRSGVLNHKTSLTFFDKVQTARLDQSPFDRRWGHARLTIDTAAAGPAEHRIAIPYLDAAFADSEYRLVSLVAAAHHPDFG